MCSGEALRLSFPACRQAGELDSESQDKPLKGLKLCTRSIYPPLKRWATHRSRAGEQVGSPEPTFRTKEPQKKLTHFMFGVISDFLNREFLPRQRRGKRT
jgi:hypothetical protein